MGQNTFDIGGSLKKAIPSLVFFVVGIFICYNFFNTNIIQSILLGWMFGGAIWGLFYTRKWFYKPYSDYSASSDTQAFTSALKGTVWILVSIITGFVLLAVGIIRLIIAISTFFIMRSKAKKAASYNTQNPSEGNTTNV